MMNEREMNMVGPRLICSFWLGTQWFGVEAASVREISSPRAFTPIPLAPAAVRGYVNLRGLLYLALDMRDLLGMPRESTGVASHLIVFKPVAGESLGVFVDRIGDIVEVEEDQINWPKIDDEESDATVLTEARAAGLIWGMARLDAGLMTLVEPRQFLPSLGRGIHVA